MQHPITSISGQRLGDGCVVAEVSEYPEMVKPPIEPPTPPEDMFAGPTSPPTRPWSAENMFAGPAPAVGRDLDSAEDSREALVEGAAGRQRNEAEAIIAVGGIIGLLALAIRNRRD